MIALAAVERDGERILRRFSAGDAAVLDVLTVAALALDGPDLGDAFRGNQAVVFYSSRAELTRLLGAAVSAPAT